MTRPHLTLIVSHPAFRAVGGHARPGPERGPVNRLALSHPLPSRGVRAAGVDGRVPRRSGGFVPARDLVVLDGGDAA